MSSHQKTSLTEGLFVIGYRAMLDVPRELVGYVSRLLAAQRRARRTRRNSRALTCWNQALFALVWFRKREDLATLGAGLGISHRLPLPRRGHHGARRPSPGPARSPGTGQGFRPGLRDPRRQDLLRRSLWREDTPR